MSGKRRAAENGLTLKQALFAKEYPVDLNATQAAIRAGYSAKTAYSSGQRMLKDPRVAAVIQAEMEKISKRIEITQDEVARGLWREAHFFGDGASHGARVSAWANLARHLGMYKEKVEVTGKDGGPVEVIDATRVREEIEDFFAEPADDTADGDQVVH